MIFNMVGGGSPLNFQVVGKDKPANPKANTIWIGSDKDVTGWAFANEEPEGFSEGMVLLGTGSESNVPLRVLSNQNIMLYPLWAKQKIAGVLTDVVAQSYVDGAWVDWFDGTLFDNGSKNEGITGGWITNLESGIYTPVTDDVLEGTATANLSFGTEYWTKNMVDLIRFGSLNVTFTGLISKAMILISKVRTDDSSSWAKYLSVTSAGTAVIDLSDVSGEYYIGIFAGARTEGVDCWFSANRVKLT